MRVGISVGLSVGITGGISPAPTVAATLDTADLSEPVATDGTAWAAVLTWAELGPGGNIGILHLHFVDGDPSAVEVRDNERYDTGFIPGWVAAPGTIGALANGTVGVDVPTIAELEAAINAGSSLAQITTADPSPSKEIDMSIMESVSTSGSFSGGA
jgi:hypothetical protein